MKICVLIKQVASEDSPLLLNEDKISLNQDGINLVSNEPDTYALEEALQIKEKFVDGFEWSSDEEVVVCTLGDESARQVIKDALSKGADKGIFIENDINEELDILTISKIFTKILSAENVDLILTGLQSDDIGNGQLGVLIAEHLNMSHASLAMETKFENSDKINVKRELENGWFQWTELNLPASITIQSGINKPRYASLRGIMMMKKKTIDMKKMSDLNISSDQKMSLKSLYAPQKSKETEKIEGTTEEMVDRIYEILKEDLRIV